MSTTESSKRADDEKAERVNQKAPVRKTTKLAEQTAARIEHEIIDNGWQVGTVLGSEVELLEKYKVSRAVLREAIRIVEHHRVATMRRGPGGGLVVTVPDVDALASVVSLHLHFDQTSPEHFYEARVALERDCARWAAERITHEGMARLRDFLENEELLATAALTERPHGFHILVADLTGNQAMRLFVQLFGRLTRRQPLTPYSTEEASAEWHEAHIRIAEAIMARDGERAEELMAKHIMSLPASLHPKSSPAPPESESAASE